jgi:hypothetical protein
MTASYGITPAEVKTFTGWTFTDLINAGVPMTTGELDAFIATYVEVCAQVVHKYCNVPTFDPAQPEAAIIELRNGKGSTDDSTYPTQYNQQDFQFYRDLYYETTAIVVQEDTAGKTAVPAWTTRTVRSALAGGDYEVITKKELTMVSFHNNIPTQGYNNVKFTYTTGYPSSSKPYADIKFQILRVFKNLILSKKGVEAIATIFANGTRDMISLPNQYSESQILSHMEESLLKRYKRLTLAGPMFD